jgi:acyl carrier protein
MLIFISYRRADSADVSGRIYDRLAGEFGDAAVFKDVDDIPFGVDFKAYLGDMVRKCDIQLAVIGPQWLDVQDDRGKRRLDNPSDFVRIEIEAALERGIPVVPLLVRGATMPKAEELPSSLADLVYRNGTPVRPDPDFHRDMDRLIRGLKNHQAPHVPQAPVAESGSPKPAPIPRQPEVRGQATDPDTMNRLVTTLVDILDLEWDEISAGTLLVDDLYMDQVDLIELIMAVENQWGLEIPDEDVSVNPRKLLSTLKLRTVSDWASYIDRSLKAR